MFLTVNPKSTDPMLEKTVKAFPTLIGEKYRMKTNDFRSQYLKKTPINCRKWDLIGGRRHDELEENYLGCSSSCSPSGPS